MSYTHLVTASPLIRRYMPKAVSILRTLRRGHSYAREKYVLQRVCDAIIADTDIPINRAYLTTDCSNIAIVFADESDAVLWALQNADLLEAA